MEAARAGAAVVAIPEVSFGQGFWSECKAFERSFYASDPVISAGRFFGRQDALDAGGYDEMLTGPEDWDLSMRLSDKAPIAFANARILHDEGRQTLADLFRKKYYYGLSMPAFVRKHGSAALRRLNPMRGALVSGLGEMIRHPVLACGMIVMKSVEALGGTAGMLYASPRDAGSIYRTTGT
jgi:arabinofuranan 3-O-arabinosyltransferase